MGVCTESAAPSGSDEFDTSAVSRILTGSRAIPFAVLREGTFTFANPAFLSLFRADKGIVGTSLTELVAPPSRAEMDRLLSDPAETPVTFRGRALRLDGALFDTELLLAREMLDGVQVICVFAEDVTRRRHAEKQLSHLAFTDMLTGLPNRALVLDRLRDAIVEARADDAGLAVFMADLDGLKRANDTFGHQAGDVVLQVTAQRFLGCIRARDTLARLGGDEFCLLLPRVKDGREAETVAARLVEVVREPISINGTDVQVGVSVGIALFPGHGSTGDALIAAADAALYAAKRGGRNRFVVASEPTPRLMVSLPLITWTAAHDVGIAMMDRQHRRLAEHVNDLAAALRGGDDPAVVVDKLAAALAYTQHHFESEERLMSACGFADAAAHRAAHEHLLDDLRSFSVGCDTRSLSLTTRFLQEWLLRHIDSADRELARALTANGVT
jgi:diguanylate cyclase (GGDEF)-like protein/hemerythrin-like metal-binding protein/PAS domain S-box-containing protein